MRLGWLTDIHLNFLGDAEEGAAKRRAFLESVRDSADAFVISGDIGEAHTVLDYLQEMAEVWEQAIYFVLGNHDYYRAWVSRHRAAVAQATRDAPNLCYLTDVEVVELTPKVALVGHDGWPDGREGNLIHSTVIVTDLILVQDLSRWCQLTPDGCYLVDKQRVADTLAALSEAAASHFERVLNQAAASYPQVLLVTHVPPFREAAWYRGRVSDDEHLPYFASRTAGEVIRRVMQKHPKCRLLVLCGHTHGEGQLRPAENVEVWTGGARYGAPQLQRVLELA